MSMDHKTDHKANVEEIWRKHGWVPPSTEDLQVIQRQAKSRGDVIDLSKLQRVENKDSRNEGIPCP